MIRSLLARLRGRQDGAAKLAAPKPAAPKPARPSHVALHRHGGMDDAAAARPLRETRFVVFDTETTGLNPSRGDAIVQIAAVRVANGRVVDGETFDSLVDPGRGIPARSTRIHGITAEMVAGAPSLLAVLPRFHAFVGEDVLVAFNAAFDLAFLRPQVKAAGLPVANPVLDVMLLAAHLWPRADGASLSSVAGRMGIDTADRHSALGDAMMTARVLVGLYDRLEAKGYGQLGKALALSQRLARRRALEHRF